MVMDDIELLLKVVISGIRFSGFVMLPIGVLSGCVAIVGGVPHV